MDASKIVINCRVSVEAGTNSELALSAVKMGNIGNFTGETIEITYEIGSATENPDPDNGGLPMVVSSNVFFDGGNSAFRESSEENGTGTRLITSDDKAVLGPYPVLHPFPENQTFWTNTTGGKSFDEFIVAYSETFKNHYVVVAKANTFITFGGTRDSSNGNWVRGTANIFLKASLSGSEPFTVTGDNQGNVTTGRHEGVRVRGYPYDEVSIFEFTEP